MSDLHERFKLAAENDFEGMAYPEVKALENAVLASLGPICDGLVKCQHHLAAMFKAEMERLMEGTD